MMEALRNEEMLNCHNLPHRSSSMMAHGIQAVIDKENANQ